MKQSLKFLKASSSRSDRSDNDVGAVSWNTADQSYLIPYLGKGGWGLEERWGLINVDWRIYKLSIPQA